MTIAANIKRLRMAASKTQKQVSVDLGLTGHQHIYLWERGAVTPSAKNIGRLAVYFGVPVDEFYKENGE